MTAWCVDADVDARAQSATEVAQPLLVAHGVALTRQLSAWGVRPDALVGHSVGELAAACVSGMLSFADTLAFAAERGRLMGASTLPGVMVAVRGAGAEDVAALVAAAPGKLAVAAYNGPGRLVLSGSPGAVAWATQELSARGASVRALEVSRAFHSPLMEPIAQDLADAARRLEVSAPGVPVMSTLTARWQPRMDPAHLREHALRPVLFGRAVARLLDEGYDTFVELGPQESLAGLVRAAALHRDVGAGEPARKTSAEDVGRDVLVVSAPLDRIPPERARTLSRAKRVKRAARASCCKQSHTCGHAVWDWTVRDPTPTVRGCRSRPIRTSAAATGPRPRSPGCCTASPGRRRPCRRTVVDRYW